MADEKCYECGKTFAQEEMFHYENSWVCANCNPIFGQKIKEGLPLSGALNYAGFGIRFAAKILDFILLIIVNQLVQLVLAPAQTKDPIQMLINLMPLMAFGTLFHCFYVTFFLGKYGATPGKMLCKLKVVTPEGEPISYGRAFGRFFAEILSAMILYIGYLMVAFDEKERRALHDRVCNTRVIKTS